MIMGSTLDIAILLNDWLTEHILVVDKKYVPFLKNIGITCMDRMNEINEIKEKIGRASCRERV